MKNFSCHAVSTCLTLFCCCCCCYNRIVKSESFTKNKKFIGLMVLESGKFHRGTTSGEDIIKL